MIKVKASKKNSKSIKEESSLLIRENNSVSVDNRVVTHDINALVDNVDNTISSSELDKINPEIRLFSDINIHDSFGIPRQITDPYSKMKHVLEIAELKSDKNGYYIRGETLLSNGDKLALEHDFNTHSKEDALSSFETYKECMLSKGLRAWMAYWKMANENGNTEYTSSMIKIMEKVSDADRSASFFSQKEKNDFWLTTRMLTNTRIKIEKSIDKKMQWIEQPLIEILGGERENDKTYPDVVQVSLLRKPHVKFFPAVYKNSTLNLHPKETNLAFYIQTRAAQLEKGNRIIRMDWPMLFSYGGVEKTAKSNSRMAKSNIHKKIKKLIEEGIVEAYSEYPSGLMITPKIQKK